MAESKQEKNYEYLDHTADVQIHSWGADLKEAFEGAAVALFDYMTELDHVEIDPNEERELEAEAEDLQSLLYTFLEEFIFMFGTEFFVAKKVKIVEFNKENPKIKAKFYGEEFDKSKHPQGTEIKAITYSAMKIIENPGKAEIYVIVDI
eukprot:TRINITY_DN2249_c0_g2_i2.p2 TRINITY_DN2249_c0_g2~~TRINITY_DN2249_c0_g2_i2.p2  ORF type:complete len:162 (+),score=49.50 TRINITY_DN2249_c0_g2_i2:40-486(+)